MKIFKFLMIFVLFITLLVSCMDDSTMDKNGGELVDKDVLSSIQKEMEEKENSLNAAQGEVFWSPSGTIWHKTYQCSYLANSKQIFHGSVEEAMLEGKERECTRCFTTEEDKVYDKLVGNPITEGDVFFTKDGKEWHSDINCSRIRGADVVYNASVDTALQLGKSNACTECNDR